MRALFCSICLQSICQARAYTARVQLNSEEEEDEACFEEYGTQDCAAQHKSLLTQDCRRQKFVQTLQNKKLGRSGTLVDLQITFASLIWHPTLFSSFDLGIVLGYSQTINEVGISEAYNNNIITINKNSGTSCIVYE